MYDPKTVGMDIMTDTQSFVAFFAMLPGIAGLLADCITSIKLFDKGYVEGGFFSKKIFAFLRLFPFWKKSPQGTLAIIETFLLALAMFVAWGALVQNVGGWWPCLIGPIVGAGHAYQALKNSKVLKGLK